MSSSTQKIIIVTKQRIADAQRKLSWFEFRNKDLYFEITGMYKGSHTSYHKDGKIFRTSFATKQKAELVDTHFRFENFNGWYQLGLGMILKSSLCNVPTLKPRDFKHQVYEVDIDQFPSKTLNIIVDLLEPGKEYLFVDANMCPPCNAYSIKTESTPRIIITILGHEHNLLITPYDNNQGKGVRLRHINHRYSATRRGANYMLEAYKVD